MKKILLPLLLIIMLFVFAVAAQAEDRNDYAVARTQFNLRSDMDTNSSIIGNVPLGAELTVLEYVDDTWCRVRYYYMTGYAKKSWLRLRVNTDTTPTYSHVAGSSSASADTASSDTAASAATASDVSVMSSWADTKSDTSGIPAVGEGSEVMYTVMTLTKFSIRQEPDMDSYRIREIKKGSDLRVLGYGTEWCKVSTLDGYVVGYAKTKWLFHFHSWNNFRWQVPGYDEWANTGYAEITGGIHVTDEGNNYGGNDLSAGNEIFVREIDGKYYTLVRRSWAELDSEKIAYHETVNWREAVEGDVIGGYTQYFGQRQGGGWYKNRQRNMRIAMTKVNGTVVKSGEEFSYNSTIGPLKTGEGYVMAGIAGGTGSGIGGGVCHISTVMYQAVLSLPFYVSEREPHTDEGTSYAPIEFDATVGVYSDLRFYNTLPYDIEIRTYFNRDAGVCTVYFICMETVDPSVLSVWDGSALSIPVKDA